MKTIRIDLLLVALCLTSFAAIAQPSKTVAAQDPLKTMDTYVIERDIPNAGKLNGAELQGISQTSCKVLNELGPGIQWLHSYVTDDKIYCVYKAGSEEILRTHAAKGGFPINKISKLSAVISPETATAPVAEIIR